MFWNVITAIELAQLSTIKLHLAILTVELLTVQTSRYHAESSIYCIRNHDGASSSMCCSGQVTSYLLHPDLGQRTKAEDRVGVRSGRLSSQTQLKSRTLLENVTKSNLSLHKVLQFASFIPLSVVGAPPAPRAQWSPPILDKPTRLPRPLQLQLRFLGETAKKKKGLLIAFQPIGGEREKQPGRWNADCCPSKADWRLCNQMLLTTISIHPLTA